MTYTIDNLLHGAKIMASKVFGHKREYKLKFNHEDDGCWYVDFPNWPFDHHNLMMVAGADKLCALLSDDDKAAYVDVSPSDTTERMEGYACLVREDHSITGGANYHVESFPEYRGSIWLCPVTLFVLGKYPKYIYFKKSKS
jgi:hypothetical protein